MSRILFVANWDWVLFNFRLPLASAARRAGHEVFLVCPNGPYAAEMRASGFEVIEWPLIRRSVNPLRETVAITRLMAIYRALKPTLIQHFTIKPSVYGSLAVRALRRCRCPLINTFSGLGFLFSRHGKARLLRAAVSPALRFALCNRQTWTVFHTEADREAFVRFGLASPDRVRLIPGSGVDTKRFRPCSAPHGRVPVVVTGARLLWDKGVGDLVAACRILRRDGVQAECWVAGETDPGNPSCIPRTTIDEWQREGIIRFPGHMHRMEELLSKADIAVLPSYYEGVPRFLLEAAAAGLPVVATDIDGCRSVVHAGVNGLLVPPRRPELLAEALGTLIRDPILRRQYGEASRVIAEDHSEDKIIAEYLRLYEEMSTS
jgi:glycosyltransferase involved in cell wall biosynthesis